jgi:16S rRNA (cytosine967-C5)-methyltransferase
VQDAGAALPARLLGDVDGRRVLDLCAAPGGKTAQLAAAGAVVLAVDRAPERMRQLAGNLARLSLAAATVAADITDWRPPEAAERILLDAPCTATGTLRRHPDIAHLKRPDDVAPMAGLQARLLAAAARMLAPGGTLVYAVCSLQAEEGPQQIDRLLAADPGLARVPVRPEETGGPAEAVTAEGDLQTLPCHWADAGGLDGFYACRLQRR